MNLPSVAVPFRVRRNRRGSFLEWVDQESASEWLGNHRRTLVRIYPLVDRRRGADGDLVGAVYVDPHGDLEPVLAILRPFRRRLNETTDALRRENVRKAARVEDPAELPDRPARQEEPA